MAFTEPQHRNKGGDRLTGGGDKVKFIALRFERGQIVGFGKARKKQDGGSCTVHTSLTMNAYWICKKTQPCLCKFETFASKTILKRRWLMLKIIFHVVPLAGYDIQLALSQQEISIIATMYQVSIAINSDYEECLSELFMRLLRHTTIE